MRVRHPEPGDRPENRFRASVPGGAADCRGTGIHRRTRGGEAGVLGSLVLVQHLSSEGVELNSHRLRVLHRLARSVVDLRAVRANSCQTTTPGPE